MALKLNGTNSVAAPAYAGADADTGLQCGTDEVNLVTGGTARLHIDSSGKIGAGTSSPKEVVDARGAAVFSGDHATSQNAYGTAHGIMLSSTSNLASIKAVSNGSNDVAIRFIPLSSGSGSEAMRVTGSGNVGIGETSPDAPLHIRDSRDEGNGSTHPMVQFSRRNGGSNDAILQGVHDGSDGIAALRLDLAGSERVRIDSSGRVGIGNTAMGSLTGNAANNFVVGPGNANAGMTVYTGTGNYGSLTFADGTSGDAVYRGSVLYHHNGDSMRFFTAASEQMRIDSSGRVGIGTTSPANPLHIADEYPTIRLQSDTGSYQGRNTVGAFQNLLSIECDNDNAISSSAITFGVDGTERMRIGSDGVVSINQTSASNIFRIQSSGANESNMLFQNSTSGTGPGNGLYVGIAPSTIGYLWNYENASLVFGTSAVERMRMTSGGTLIIGSTDSSLSATGSSFTAAGSADHTRNGGNVVFINRLTNDGNLIQFYGDTNFEGSISISGSTISYNGGHLTRWSQLTGGAERTEILRGSVLSNLDEMCEWGEEDNEQLNRMKISDVEGDVNVSGVFQDWDDDDDTYTNDFYCAMTGDFVIRIAQGTTVARGDLLMSAGDGTAKPQDDDIVRSKTIAKVTSTTVSTTYSDGSYCVPCVLMAC